MSVIGINAPTERSTSLLDVEEKYGVLTGYFFTINCIVGAGVLSLPWAYANGGWMLCIIA
jgi:amino acid permease